MGQRLGLIGLVLAIALLALVPGALGGTPILLPPTERLGAQEVPMRRGPGGLLPQPHGFGIPPRDNQLSRL